MIKLFDSETGAALGSITDEQFQFLTDHLEEESDSDEDYYINQATVEIFQEQGADAELLKILRQALGNREDMEIRWTRA